MAWLPNDVPACRDLAAAWLVRGATPDRSGMVLDVQPKLAARVRLLATGAVNKNDPNDARSVAIAALRSHSCLPVRPGDHAAVLKIWAKRHHDLSRARPSAQPAVNICRRPRRARGAHAAARTERDGHGRVSRALSRRYWPYRLAAWSRASICGGVRAR